VELLPAQTVPGLALAFTNGNGLTVIEMLIGLLTHPDALDPIIVYTVLLIGHTTKLLLLTEPLDKV
jgi:hypothetical protein